jgi:hypothetical protein
MDERPISDQNPLDLIQAVRIVGAVMELGPERRLVVHHLLAASGVSLP